MKPDSPLTATHLDLYQSYAAHDPDKLTHSERRLVATIAALRTQLEQAHLERDSFQGQAEYERQARIDAANFPRNRHGYIACHRCGLDCGMDAIVATEIWALIAPDPETLGGMLCLWCMDEALAELGMEHVPVALYFPGRALLSLLYDAEGEILTRPGSPWFQAEVALLRQTLAAAEARETALREALLNAQTAYHNSTEHKGIAAACNLYLCKRWRALSGEQG